jgi:hypothetical protein
MSTEAALEERVMSHAPAHAEKHDAHAKHGHDHGPDPVKEFYERNKKLNSWIETHKIAHSEAYTSAAKKFLKAGKGYDLQKLNDADVRKQFIDHIVESYLNHAKEVHGVSIAKDGKGGFAERDLLYLMSGHTRESLEQEINGAKEGYTLDAHREMTKRHIGQLAERHSPYTIAHLDEKKDKDTIHKFLNIEGNKDLSWGETLQALGNYLSSDIGRARYKKTYESKKDAGHAAHH